jgi:hypothetical protein
VNQGGGGGAGPEEGFRNDADPGLGPRWRHRRRLGSQRWAGWSPNARSCAQAVSYLGAEWRGGTLPWPAGKGVDAVRRILDEFDARVRGLLDELGHGHVQVEATVSDASQDPPTRVKRMRSRSGHLPCVPQMVASVRLRTVSTGAVSSR